VVTQHSLGLRAEVPIREGLPWRMAVIPSVALVAPASAEVPPQGRQRRIGAALYIFDAEAQAGRSPLGGLAGVAEARVAEALREGRNVAVSRALAAAGDLRVGDSLTLATAAGSRDYRIAAVVPDNRTAQSSLFMDRRLYLSDWRGEHVSLYTVALEQTAEPERVAALLQRALEGRYAAKVMSVSEYRAEIRKAVRDTFGFTQLLAAIIVLIAVGGLINAGLESLFALRRDLATLRALGVRARFLKAMLFAEIALQGGVAVVAGTLLGSLLSAVLLRGVQVWGHLPLPWQPPAAAYALPLGIAVALTALVALLLLRTVPPKLSGRPFGG
jgi:predicted lysophospholipase L1 biosynthesis ABC-type transport system permease subunit